MKKMRTLLLIVLVISLMTVLSCQTLPKVISGEIPTLSLKHGWSPPQTKILNDEEVQVRCMTQEDVDTLTIYLKFIQTMGTVNK